MLTDAQWNVLEPLLEQCRPRGKTPPKDLRRRIEAILWRHGNGAKWRSVPTELGPGGGRLRALSAGPIRVSGSACCAWRKNGA